MRCDGGNCLVCEKTKEVETQGKTMSDNVEPISDLLTQSLTVLFTEAYAGPPDLSSTWVTTNEPNSAILGNH